MHCHAGIGVAIRLGRAGSHPGDRRAHGVPPRFFVQILLQLKGAGLVASVRGAAGGYRLLSPPEQISLGRIMEVVDGLLDEEAPKSTASPDSPAVKVLTQAWKEVSAMQFKMLDGITLADLFERAKEQGEQMFPYVLRGPDCEAASGFMRAVNRPALISVSLIRPALFACHACPVSTCNAVSHPSP